MLSGQIDFFPFQFLLKILYAQFEIQFMVQKLNVCFSTLNYYLKNDLAKSLIVFLNSLTPGRYEWSYLHRTYDLISLLSPWMKESLRLTCR
jgi:hypothetical protein